MRREANRRRAGPACKCSGSSGFAGCVSATDRPTGERPLSDSGCPRKARRRALRHAGWILQCRVRLGGRREEGSRREGGGREGGRRQLHLEVGFLLVRRGGRVLLDGRGIHRHHQRLPAFEAAKPTTRTLSHGGRRARCSVFAASITLACRRTALEPCGQSLVTAAGSPQVLRRRRAPAPRSNPHRSPRGHAHGDIARGNAHGNAHALIP